MWQVAAYDEEFEAMAWSFRSRDASGRRQQHSILVHVCPHLEAVSRSRLVKEGNRTCRVGKGVEGGGNVGSVVERGARTQVPMQLVIK